MWWVLVPVVLLWIALPWLALDRTQSWYAVPGFARELPAYAALRWVAAAAAVACLALTARCWRRMGADWRMAVSKRDSAPLITDGLFARVRHPIYALSMLLMLCSLLIVPTLPMLAVALAHWCLMTLKARNEERHMLEVHGAAYLAYQQRTGRFLPRLAA